MIPTKSKEHTFFRNTAMALVVKIDLHEFPDEPFDIPSEINELIRQGLCTNCNFLGMCVWQHNNKLSCEHFK